MYNQHTGLQTASVPAEIRNHSEPTNSEDRAFWKHYNGN